MEGRTLRGGAKRELIHIGLAHRQTARLEHALHAGGGVDALVVLEHARCAGSARTHEIHVVFDCQGHTRKRGQGLASSASGVDASGGIKRELGGYLQKGLDGAVTRLNGIERCVRHLGSGKVTRGNARGNLGRGQRIDIQRHYSLSPSPRMDGTRK